MKPTWDELRDRQIAADIAAETIKHAAPLELMHFRHGTTPGKRCGDCVYLVGYRQAHHWFKCRKHTVENGGKLGGPKTDWRKKFAACGLFEERKGNDA